MKTKLKLVMLAIIMIAVTHIYAQNGVAIGSGTPTPNASALVDMQSSNKGLLIPRVALTSVTDATTISSPATSLLVYNTGTGGLTPAGYYYNSATSGANWVRMLPIQGAGTTGQVPTSTGASTLATWSTPPSKFIIPYYQRYYVSSVAQNANYYCNGTGFGWNTFDGIDYNTTGFGTAPASIVSSTAPYYSTFVATSSGIFNKFTAWIMCETVGGKTINVYIYKYTPTNNSNVALTGTSLGSASVTCTNALYNYSLTITGSGSTTFNAGDIIIIYCRTSNWATGNGTVYSNVMGSLELQY